MPTENTMKLTVNTIKDMFSEHRITRISLEYDVPYFEGTVTSEWANDMLTAALTGKSAGPVKADFTFSVNKQSVPVGKTPPWADGALPARRSRVGGGKKSNTAG